MGKKDYSNIIKKQDWEKSRNEMEALYVNSQINGQHYLLCLKNIDKHLAEFKDEVDEIVDEVIEDG